MLGFRVWREIAPKVWSLATVQVFAVREQAQAYALQIHGRIRVWPSEYHPPGVPAPSAQAVRQGAAR